MGVCVALIVLVVAGWVQAAEWRGVSRALEDQADLDHLAADSVGVVVVGLLADALVSDSVFQYQERNHDRIVQAFEDSLGLMEGRAEALETVTDSLVDELADSVREEVQPIIDSYELRLDAKDYIIETVITGRRLETARADSASALAVTWRSVALTSRREVSVLRQEVVSLRGALEAANRSMNPSIGLRLKADWWIGVGGVVIGYAIGSRKPP